jgi:hypothetical protein
MAEISQKAVAIFYHELPNFDADPRPVDTGDIHRAILLCPGGDGIMFNIFESIKIHYKQTGQTAKDASVTQLATWRDKFQQSLWRSCLLLPQLRVESQTIREKILDAPSMVAFAQSLGEAIEMGRLILTIGAELAFDVSPIEVFLADPLTVETTHIPAIDCAKRLFERYKATKKPNHAATIKALAIAIPTAASTLSALSGHWEDWWMKYGLVWVTVSTFSYAVYWLLSEKTSWKRFSMIAVAAVTWIIVGSAVGIAYLRTTVPSPPGPAAKEITPPQSPSPMQPLIRQNATTTPASSAIKP